MKVDFSTTVGKIASISGGKVVTGNPDTSIDAITTDSRELGNNNLFISLIGEKFDGHDFILSLVKEKKINSFISMKDGYKEIAEENGVSEILCNDTLNCLGAIAADHRSKIDPTVIGITGTNGKTTTKELVYSIISKKYNSLKNDKNYNNEIGVPFTLLKLNEAHKVAVIEMGMNHSGELDRLSIITKPDVALITNVGEGHLEFLGSVENVAYAKSEIIHGMKPGSTLLLNRETECFDLIKEKVLKMNLKLKTFGISNNADYCPDEYKLTEKGIKFKYKGIEIDVPLYGIHNVFNIVAAISIAEEVGVELNLIKDGIEEFKNIDGRSQIIDKGYIVIDDTYNSNPLSSKYALKSVFKIFPKRRKIAVLSDMKELGDSAEAFHLEIGMDAGENKFDMLLLFGDMSDCYMKGAIRSGIDKDNVKIFSDKEELSNFLKSIVDKNDVILVKGSRSMKMEEVVKALIN